MLHICRSAKTKEFYVVVLGRNGEVLSTSELLKSKAAAIKNVKAQVKSFFGEENDDAVTFQDDTFPKSKMFYTYKGKHYTSSVLPHPIYTPSKKSKKK
jgi:uncharacterized protein YegP (UPF0339 family)